MRFGAFRPPKPENRVLLRYALDGHGYTPYSTRISCLMIKGGFRFFPFVDCDAEGRIRFALDVRPLQPLADSRWKCYPPLCHPDRSGGICSSPNQCLILMKNPLLLSQPASSATSRFPVEVPPSPLSSRPKWRDLQFAQSVLDLDENPTPVIPAGLFVFPSDGCAHVVVEKLRTALGKISTVGVLRLCATKPAPPDKSVRRFAQDDVCGSFDEKHPK
jgi:hypothetical protein